MIRGKYLSSVFVILLAQIGSILFHVVRRVKARPALVRLVSFRPMGEVAPKEEYVTRCQRHGDPVVAILPCGADSATLAKLNVAHVRPRDDLQAAVGNVCLVNGNIGGDVMNLPNVAVGMVVHVGVESVAVWQLIVDLVLEEKRVL